MGELLQVLFWYEVEDFGHAAVLDDRHALDRVVALHAHTAGGAVAGAAQLAQVVERGQGRHGGGSALLALDLSTEEAEALTSATVAQNKRLP